MPANQKRGHGKPLLELQSARCGTCGEADLRHCQARTVSATVAWMSFTELTEAFLMKCAGWEAVKIARVPPLAKERSLSEVADEV